MATPVMDNGQITQREKFSLLTSMFDEHQMHLENIESDNTRHPDTPIISLSVALSSPASHLDVQNLWTTLTSLLEEPQAPTQQVQAPPTLSTVPLPLYNEGPSSARVVISGSTVQNVHFR
jgi:hypothetical protein